MEKEIKQEELINIIILKLSEINTKLNNMDKLLRNMQKSVLKADNKVK